MQRKSRKPSECYDALLYYLSGGNQDEGILHVLAAVGLAGRVAEAIETKAYVADRLAGIDAGQSRRMHICCRWAKPVELRGPSRRTYV